MKLLTQIVMNRFIIVMLLMAALSCPLSFANQATLAETDQKPVIVDFNNVVEKNGFKPQPHHPTQLRIAVAAMISPQYTYRYYVEMLDVIGQKMGRGVTLVQKKTYAQVNEMLKDGELDLAFVCSGPYVLGKEEFGMEIIAVPVCHGESVYYSYFIAPKNGGIRSFEDLRGKVFAFTDPLSNTGCMVPTYILAKSNETPETFFRKTFFSHSHDNSIRAVSEHLADGASVDSLIYDFLESSHPELTENTMIVEKSPPYGIPPVVVNPSMDPEEKTRLKQIFLSIHLTAEGKEALSRLHIDRFVEGHDEDYATVRELQTFLESKQH